jgi:lysine-N-methylase
VTGGVKGKSRLIFGRRKWAEDCSSVAGSCLEDDVSHDAVEAMQAAVPWGEMPELPPGLPPVRVPPAGVPGREPDWPGERPGWTPERPRYAERFRCIASACEDTCCTGWGVPIDRGTYEKYRSHAGLKPFVGTLIVLNANGPTTQDYARMPLTESGRCGFLDAERLCGIQKQMGSGMLSHTCATYPRAISTNGGDAEVALNLSCPEAARLALLDENLLGGAVWSGVGGWYEPLLRGIGAGGRADEMRLLVREYALRVVRDRSYPLWQRMLLLGAFTRRLQGLSEGRGGRSVLAWCEENPGLVRHVLAEETRVADEGRRRLLMAGFEARTAEQLQVVMEILRLRVARTPVAQRFLACIAEFEQGLGTAAAGSEGEILARYASNEERFYEPLMVEHPQLLENFLVNHIFKNQYPFGKQPEHPAVGYVHASDAEREHLSMCAHLALAQTMLIGMAGHFGADFGCEQVVRLVQSLARAVEHSKEFLEELLRLLEVKQMKSMAGIAVLVRPPG